MNITDRIRDFIRNHVDLVFRTSEFFALGSKTSVNRALKELCGVGVLIRLGVGVYAKAKPSVISGKPIPVQPLEVLGPQALAKFGVHTQESVQTSRYNSGLSNQVPVGVVVNVGRQQVHRKIGFNAKFLKYERT